MPDATPIEAVIDRDRLRSVAASGASGLAKKAQAELRRITTEALRRAVQGRGH